MNFTTFLFRIKFYVGYKNEHRNLHTINTLKNYQHKHTRGTRKINEKINKLKTYVLSLKMKSEPSLYVKRLKWRYIELACWEETGANFVIKRRQRHSFPTEWDKSACKYFATLKKTQPYNTLCQTCDNTPFYFFSKIFFSV